MTDEERIAIWKANEELQEEMIATRDVRIAELKEQVAAWQNTAHLRLGRIDELNTRIAILEEALQKAKEA